MNVCYPLTTQLDYTELKYSLRSIEKYLQPLFEVIIVGDHVPEWLTNVTNIQLPDIKGQIQLSVRRKILAALHYYNCDEMFYLNDDIFLLQPTDNTFPYYTSGPLTKVGESGVRPLINQLQSFNKPLKYYGHYPSVYRKDFVQVMENFSSECLTKSAYLNYREVDSIEVPDCKLITAKKPEEIKSFIKNKPCFSTGVHSINSALPVLKELFPDPSKFEI